MREQARGKLLNKESKLEEANEKKKKRSRVICQQRKGKRCKESLKKNGEKQGKGRERERKQRRRFENWKGEGHLQHSV